MLDLATGAASAVRESSRSSTRALPKSLRPARLVCGPSGGCMPAYSRKDAEGQERLYRMNGRDYAELYVGHEHLRAGEEDLQVDKLLEIPYFKGNALFSFRFLWL